MAGGSAERNRSAVNWWVRVDEPLPMHYSTDVEAVAAGINSRVSAHARRLGREPEIVRVRLGDRVALSDAELAHVFTRLARNGPLARAELVIERVQTRWHCPQCDTLQTLATSCDCHAPVAFTAGDEMMLESMQG